jgi:hypothetical protein
VQSKQGVGGFYSGIRNRDDLVVILLLILLLVPGMMGVGIQTGGARLSVSADCPICEAMDWNCGSIAVSRLPAETAIL